MERSSHGDGRWDPGELAAFGEGAVIEPTVLVFHPASISVGAGVYVGHGTILKGYHRNEMRIGAGSWIGEQCYLGSAGGLTIGENVGIGPGVRILTSEHEEEGPEKPIIEAAVRFDPVTIEDDADIGIGTILLPGVTIGRGARVGAGSVVTADIPSLAVAAGTPARVMRSRGDG
ncbi:MAG: hypothetical protein QOJ38_1120 [Solirubrobacterales bacterium]|jgi:acetyltransferase-like isoleucine patch superfamily enzyme|nr:hypothetical protein [Solirubrobacterales bacterium]